MRDRAAERRLLRALGVDVDELVVAGDVGEGVDVLLGDLVPVADAELLADVRLDLVDAGDGEHGPEPMRRASLARMATRPLLAVDRANLLFRAFHALPDSITTRDRPVNALLGTANYML